MVDIVCVDSVRPRWFVQLLELWMLVAGRCGALRYCGFDVLLLIVAASPLGRHTCLPWMSWWRGLWTATGGKLAGCVRVQCSSAVLFVWVVEVLCVAKKYCVHVGCLWVGA